MSVKYIIDNSSNSLLSQSIHGNLTVNGNLSVTGLTTGSLATYRALLTQTQSVTGTTINDFNYALIIGETYVITNYVPGDDFSNIANVQSGNINETNCTFIATGQTPSAWSNSSELVSSGNLVVTLLESNLGYDIEWIRFSTGNYLAFPTLIGPKYNNFPRANTSVLSQMTLSTGAIGIEYVKHYTMPVTFTSKDDTIILFAWDSNAHDSVDNTLYYTPIEIKIKMDEDDTPIVLSGSVLPSYPFSYASIDLFCNGNNVESFVGDNTTVNNIGELVDELNSNQQTSFLGTYSDDGLGNVLLTIPTNLVNRFCPNGNLTFEVFSD